MDMDMTDQPQSQSKQQKKVNADTAIHDNENMICNHAHDDDDDLSFTSALEPETPITESFLTYSTRMCMNDNNNSNNNTSNTNNPNSLCFDWIDQTIPDASSHTNYDDALSQYYSGSDDDDDHDDFSICDAQDGGETGKSYLHDDDLSYDTHDNETDNGNDNGNDNNNNNNNNEDHGKSNGSDDSQKKEDGGGVVTKKGKKKRTKATKDSTKARKSAAAVAALPPQRQKLTSIAFNQDKDCIALSTNMRYQIRTIGPNPNEPYQIHELPVPIRSKKTTDTSINSNNNNSNNNSNNSNNNISSNNTNSATASGVSHIQILHRTSLLAIVKFKTPRVLSIIHAKTARVVKELSFTSAIRRVEMNRLTLVVLTANGQLHIFAFQKGTTSTSSNSDDDGNGGNSNESKKGVTEMGIGEGYSTGDIKFVKTMSILHESESQRIMTAEAASTQGAFYDLSSHLVGGSYSWLVTKSSDGLGSISVYKITCSSRSDGTEKDDEEEETQVELKSTELVHSLSAHNHGIGRIAIGGTGFVNDSDNENGGDGDGNVDDNIDRKVFATSSTQGTIIRVFSLLHGQKLYEFQRGSSPCTIFSLAFNVDATILSVSGSKGTIHLFRLSKETQVDYNPKNESGTGTLPQRGGKYLMSGISNIMKLVSAPKKKEEHNNDNDNEEQEQPKRQKQQIVRSFCKLRLKGERLIVPNIIAMLKPTYTENAEREDNVVICLKSGKIFQFAVQSETGRSRPIRVDDLLFRKD